MSQFPFPDLDAEKEAQYELFPINLTRMMLDTQGLTLPYWQYGLSFRNSKITPLVRERVILRVGAVADCEYTGKLVTRGVFVDLPAHRGVDTLEPGYAITTDDLDEYLAAKNLEIRPGDALIVRTGFMAARRGKWGDYAGGPSPGLSLHTAPWLRDNDVTAVATDTWGIEVLPNEIDVWQPLHVVGLAHTGLAFGEMFDLDALSKDSRADGIYEFMLVASPLPLTGASGSPVSVLAIK